MGIASSSWERMVRIVWRADYGGAPKYTMYVPMDTLLADLRAGTQEDVESVAQWTCFLLTPQQCAFCTHAKDLLDRRAADYYFSVITLDVASPEGEGLAVRSGIVFPVPAFFWMASPFLWSSSEQKLRQALERWRSASGKGISQGPSRKENYKGLNPIFVCFVLIALASERCWRPGSR